MERETFDDHMFQLESTTLFTNTSHWRDYKDFVALKRLQRVSGDWNGAYVRTVRQPETLFHQNTVNFSPPGSFSDLIVSFWVKTGQQDHLVTWKTSKTFVKYKDAPALANLDGCAARHGLQIEHVWHQNCKMKATMTKINSSITFQLIVWHQIIHFSHFLPLISQC